jgi:DNA-binding transcriptional MocR family regulator
MYADLAYVVDDQPVTAPVVKCLLALIADADGPGGCFVSQDTLARYMNCGVRTVRRAMDAAQAAGLIELEPRTAPDGRRLTPYIRLHYGQLRACEPTGQSVQATGQSVQATGQIDQDHRPDCHGSVTDWPPLSRTTNRTTKEQERTPRVDSRGAPVSVDPTVADARRTSRDHEQELADAKAALATLTGDELHALHDRTVAAAANELERRVLAGMDPDAMPAMLLLAMYQQRQQERAG